MLVRLIQNAVSRYEKVLTAILDHEMECSTEGVELPHILQLDKDARQEWQSFALRVEAGMREGEIYHHMTDWAGKLPGAVIRIAGLLHVDPALRWSTVAKENHSTGYDRRDPHG